MIKSITNTRKNVLDKNELFCHFARDVESNFNEILKQIQGDNTF